MNGQQGLCRAVTVENLQSRSSSTILQFSQRLESIVLTDRQEGGGSDDATSELSQQ
jgi:hypothetical protein